MVYHISEEPEIKEFIPRKSELYIELPPVVWAIDEEHIVNYYFPRDCPRIIYRYTNNVVEEDKYKYFSNTVSETIITVENRWYKTIKNAILYKYIFEMKNFQLIDEIAGYYITEEKIIPKAVEKIDNLMEELLIKNIELRFTPNIFPLRNTLIKSSINDYSIIRFRNAKE
jgi:hypothetical protein